MSFNNLVYDKYITPLTSKYTEHILSILPPSTLNESASALDVGCGTGCAISSVKSKGLKYVGVDNDEGMVRIASEKSEAHFHDCKDLPDRWENCFEIAFSNFGVIFSEDFKTSIEEMVRCTTPTGCVAISCWAEPEKTRVFHLFGDALEKVTGDRPAKGRVKVDVVQETLGEALGGGEKAIVEVTEVVEYLEAESKDWLWKRFTESSRRLGELVAGLDEEQRERVREHVYKEIDEIGEVVAGGQYRFPVTAYIVHGRKK